MALTRRTVLTTGGALALGTIAGCQSILPGSSRPLAYIDVTNKSKTEKTITLAVSEGTETAPNSYKLKNTFTLGAGETREAVREGQTPTDHTVPGSATYMIEIRIEEEGPTSTGVIQWQDATGTFIVDVYEDRVKTRIDEDG